MEFAYEIESKEKRERFVFYSGEGAGAIIKVVYFDPFTPESNVYNLSLGDSDGDPWQDGAKADFEVMSNKGDVLKVMNTVALCVEMFLEKNPDASIFFSGNTEKRTRIYLNLISRNWKMLQNRFLIEGITENGFVSFEPDNNYFGVMLTKKIIN